LGVTGTETHRAIDAVWRIESARLIAGLARLVGDVGAAEDLAQDALVAALERWPETGVPDNPGAWLMATAKHRAIDQLRRRSMLERKHDQLGHELEARQELAVPDLDAALDDHVGDDLLRLMFTACHPMLSMEEAVEWLKRAPFQDAEVELRRFHEAADFGDALTPDLREQEQRLRDEVESREK
jgi:predicted RNA polymerase sigma factor